MLAGLALCWTFFGTPSHLVSHLMNISHVSLAFLFFLLIFFQVFLFLFFFFPSTSSLSPSLPPSLPPFLEREQHSCDGPLGFSPPPHHLQRVVGELLGQSGWHRSLHPSRGPDFGTVFLRGSTLSFYSHKYMNIFLTLG